MNQDLRIGGVFHVEHIRDGKVIDRQSAKNMVTTQGKNYALDVMFRSAQSKINSWYIGLIGSTAPTTLAVTDAAPNTKGWTQAEPYATPAARPAWSPGAAANASMTNSTAAEYTINAGATLTGIFITDLATKGGNIGTAVVFSTAAFSSPITVVSGDTFRVTYTLGAS